MDYNQSTGMGFMYCLPVSQTTLSRLMPFCLKSPLKCFSKLPCLLNLRLSDQKPSMKTINLYQLPRNKDFFDAKGIVRVTNMQLIAYGMRLEAVTLTAYSLDIVELSSIDGVCPFKRWIYPLPRTLVVESNQKKFMDMAPYLPMRSINFSNNLISVHIADGPL